MKKLLLCAAVSAAVLSGTAHAVISEDAAGKPIFSAANTYEVYISGASAPRQFLESYLTSPSAGVGSVPAADRLCTGKVYKFAGTTANNNYNAYLCEMNGATNVAGYNGLKGVGGKVNVLVHKRSAGGSAQGVSPVIADDPIDFLDVSVSLAPTIPAACTVASTSANLNVISCPTPAPGANLNRPDFGVSDVDPAQFKGSNTPLGFTPVNAAGLAKLTVRPAFAQIFGIPVSLKLRNALQQIQFPVTNKCNPLHPDYLYTGPLPVPAAKDSSTAAGYQPWAENAACVPTMTKGDIASILTGKITSGKQLFTGANNLFDYIAANNPALLPGNPSIHICSRVNGSGTKATTDIKFLNYPCSSAATQAEQDTGGLDPVANSFIDFALFGFTPEALGQPQVHQNSSGGDVNECFNELNSGASNATGNFRNNPFVGARWAIGVQGTDNNANLANAYRYIKINNVLPLGSQVVTDNFFDWVESTYQFNGVDHVYAAGVPVIRDFVISKTGLPSVVSIINKAGAGYGSFDPVAGTFISGTGQGFHSWATTTILSGFLATPSNPSVTTTATGQYNATTPINPLSHDTTTAGAVIDNCRAPALFSAGAGFNKGLQLK